MSKTLNSSLVSMTGFARHEGNEAGHSWVWELKSLNHRNLDVRARVPSFVDSMEADIRKLVPSYMTRGSINVNLQVQREAGEGQLRLNEAALAQVIEAAEKVRLQTECAPSTAEGLLSIRGVLILDEEVLAEDEKNHLISLLLASLKQGLQALNMSRAEEGAKMLGVLVTQVDEIEKLTNQAQAIANNSLELIRDRIKKQVAELLESGLSEERLAQEVAVLAVKGDIREELDRLIAHVASARALLAAGEPVGRKLDFLSQEFNREANTLCSKAQTIELKQIGLDLKTVIDQMREQVQNIE